MFGLKHLREESELGTKAVSNIRRTRYVLDTLSNTYRLRIYNLYLAHHLPHAYFWSNWLCVPAHTP